MEELSSECTEKLQKELHNSKEVIRSTETVCDTLRKLANDKDEIITQQKVIIYSCRCRSKDSNEELTNIRKKLEESNNLIEERNMELREAKELLEEKNEEVGANGNRKLEKELAKSLQLNEDLRNELTTKVTITKKTELAFNTQTELVETKEELINNQRIVIEHMKKAVEEDANRIDATSIENEHPSVPGLQESVLCMTNLALHGVILNGFLVWADIQRRTTAENIWNAQALKHFIKEEITDAKELLWDVVDNGVLGNMIKRQGPSKSTAEINDISHALKKLAEKEVMPLFLGTSNMVMQTPSSNVHDEKVYSGEIVKTLKTLEDSMKRFVVKKNEDNKNQVNNENVENHLKTLEESINCLVKSPGLNTTCEKDHGDYVDNRPWSEVVRGKRRGESVMPSQITTNNGVNGVDKTNNWRKSLNLLQGTALGTDGKETLSSDIDLVTYGVTKNITAIQLSNFMQNKGLNAIDCVLLTKYNGARSLTFNITIKATDFEKAKDPDIWPYRIGLRYYKQFNNIQANQIVADYAGKKHVHVNGGILKDNRAKKVWWSDDAGCVSDV